MSTDPIDRLFDLFEKAGKRAEQILDREFEQEEKQKTRNQLKAIQICGVNYHTSDSRKIEQALTNLGFQKYENHWRKNATATQSIKSIRDSVLEIKKQCLGEDKLHILVWEEIT